MPCPQSPSPAFHAGQLLLFRRRHGTLPTLLGTRRPILRETAQLAANQELLPTGRHPGLSVARNRRAAAKLPSLTERIATDHGQDADDWWRHGQPPEMDEDPEG